MGNGGQRAWHYLEYLQSRGKINKGAMYANGSFCFYFMAVFKCVLNIHGNKMKKRLLCGLLCLILVLQWPAPLWTGNADAASSPGSYMDVGPAEHIVTDIEQYDTNEMLVVYKDEKSRASNLPDSAREQKLTKTCSVIEVGSTRDLEKSVKALSNNDDVLFLEPNYKMVLLETNDTYTGSQWAYKAGTASINMEEARALGTGENKETIVAVIDTGVDYQHADLAANMWVNEDEAEGGQSDNDKNGFAGDYYGWNFAQGNNVVCDYKKDAEGDYVDSHGTHVAGIIGAVMDNGIGVAGVAGGMNVKLMSVKVMADDGYTSMSDVIAGIQYAENNGAVVCNLSLGTQGYSTILYAVMKSSDMLFVCAAGNGDKTSQGMGWDISRRPVYPAAFDLDNIIAVANVNISGVVDNSSCYSRELVDIAAPGTEILSTYVDPDHTSEGKYVAFTGTSMAAPFVTGTAAYLYSYFGGLTTEQLRELILSGSKSMTPLSAKVIDGAYLDIYGSLMYGKGAAAISTSITDVKKSNKKNYNITIRNSANKGITVLYAEGTQDVSYFQGGTVGTPLTFTDNKATIPTEKTTTYTIYLKDAEGNEAVRTETVQVPELKKVTLGAKQKTLKTGKTYKIKTTLGDKGVYAKITYKTSNKKVASVSPAGKVTAKKKGKATITVTASYGGISKKAVCKITVK